MDACQQIQECIRELQNGRKVALLLHTDRPTDAGGGVQLQLLLLLFLIFLGPFPLFHFPHVRDSVIFAIFDSVVPAAKQRVVRCIVGPDGMAW